MKAVAVILQIFFLCLLPVGVGCEPMPPTSQQPPKVDNGFDKLAVYTRYAPVKIDIMPLTEFVCIGDVEDASQIKVYVSLLDSFGCQIKSPGVFRFELYERVQRSAKPKGKRIIIWPDVDLTDVGENNCCWRDFLRAYEFTFDFEPQTNQSYVLQITYLCPDGRRLLDEFELPEY